MQLSAINKILIVGLGNPGKEYDTTPHNIGFAVIDELANGVKKGDEKFAEIYEVKMKKVDVVLAKPKAFMNISGTAVLSLIKNYNLKPKTSLWLVHDDIDLPLGTIRVQFGRGSAGHKGVADVIDKLETQDFWRFRIGVRPPLVQKVRSREWMNKFVTQRAVGERKKKLNEAASQCAQLIEKALKHGVDEVAGSHKVKMD